MKAASDGIARSQGLEVVELKNGYYIEPAVNYFPGLLLLDT
jgi:hypothetical protein